MDSAGKTACCSCGATHPKYEGSMRNPAIISATACVCPTCFAPQPTQRHTAMMNPTWRKKKTARDASVIRSAKRELYTPEVPARIDLLPHAPPMRLVEEIVHLDPGVTATCRRATHA